MGLRHNPAVTIQNLIGGYNTNATYITLQDNETNSAENVIISRVGSLKEIGGYQKFFTTSMSATLTGFFQFIKSKGQGRYELVGARTNLYTITSGTGSYTKLYTGGPYKEGVYWDFEQIQDPRSAANEIAVATNGVDKIVIWDGNGSAVTLDTVTSATQVPIAKYINVLKGRLYALNIADETDADSHSKIMATEFDEDTGAPRPQRFTNAFYVGGSDKSGEITGGVVFRDTLIIFKERGMFQYLPGYGNNLDTSNLIQISDNIGCIAPRSIATDGNRIFFLSHYGLYSYDGATLSSIGTQIEQDLNSINPTRKLLAQGHYIKEENQYWLSLTSRGKTYNDFILIYDLTLNLWQPPHTDIRAAIFGTYLDGDNKEELVHGDHIGFLYSNNRGSAFGAKLGYTGTPDSSTLNIIDVSGADLPVEGDGLKGVTFRIIDGGGKGQESLIDSNTSGTVTLIDTLTGINSATVYTIGGIDSYFRTKDYDFGATDIDKKFVKAFLRTKQKGDYNITVHYIVDFRQLERATTKIVSLYSDGFIWGVGKWGTATWGGTEVMFPDLCFRATGQQSLTGKFMALRFSNRYPNQPWEIYGFDIVAKAVGRR